MTPRWYRLAVAVFFTMLLVLNVGYHSQAAEQTEREPVELVVSNIWGGERIPLMEAMFQEFEKKYPWITVVNQIETTSGLVEKGMVSIATGNPPDVWMVDRANLAEFVESGLLQPIDGYVEEAGLDLSIFFPFEIELSRYKGETYVLPMPAATLSLLYYNRHVFNERGLDPDAPPQDWDTWTQAALRLQHIDGEGNVLIGGGDIRAWPRFKLAQFGYLNGAEVLGSDGLSANYLSPHMREAAQWVHDFTQRVSHEGDITAGTLAMKTHGDYHYFYYKDHIDAGDVGVAALPHGPQGESQSLASAAWSFGIPVGAKHPYESYLLIQFLSTSETGARGFTLQQGRLSPVIQFATDPVYYENKYWDVIVNSLMQAVIAPPSPVTAAVLAADLEAYSKLFWGEVAPDVALEQLQERVDAIFEAYKTEQR